MLDLQTYLSNAVAAERRKTFEKSDQLSLGEIISKCEAIAEKNHKLSDGSEITVRFDFEYLRPDHIGSWRGIYAELALGFVSEDEIKLSEFLTLLKEADGKTFEGYKGGDFTMSRHTPVWVANYGNSGNTAVVDVVDAEYEVILITAYRNS